MEELKQACHLELITAGGNESARWSNSQLNSVVLKPSYLHVQQNNSLLQDLGAGNLPVYECCLESVDHLPSE